MITEIERYTFGGCSNLQFVVIPPNVKTIKAEAFQYCHQLSQVTFSEGLVRIEKNAFDYCPIGDVKLPKSATNVFKLAFGKYGLY